MLPTAHACLVVKYLQNPFLKLNTFLTHGKPHLFGNFPSQHLSAHLEPGAGQRAQSFQICLHLHLPFLTLRKATNNTPDPWPHGKEMPLSWLENPQCELFETIFIVICFLLSLLMNWLVNVFLIWTEIDRSSTWYLRSQTFWRWNKSCPLYRLSKSPLKFFFFPSWYAFLKDSSYLFGTKSTSGKFNRWRHDNWPIGEWKFEHNVTREAVGEAIFVIDLFKSMEVLKVF